MYTCDSQGLVPGWASALKWDSGSERRHFKIGNGKHVLQLCITQFLSGYMRYCYLKWDLQQCKC